MPTLVAPGRQRLNSELITTTTDGDRLLLILSRGWERSHMGITSAVRLSSKTSTEVQEDVIVLRAGSRQLTVPGPSVKGFNRFATKSWHQR